MKTERCWHLCTASMFTYEDGNMLRWFPNVKSTAGGMITGYQGREPDRSDVDYGTKARLWAFQMDIKAFFFDLVKRSRTSGTKKIRQFGRF